MAVDKKSEHYTSAESYTDLDGQSRQFTFVDHDKKTKIGTSSGGNLVELKEQLKTYADRQIAEILALPAVSAVRNNDGLYEEFIIRDEKVGIVWNEPMVRDACSINRELARNLHNQCWKRTVKESNWYDDMSHEDILAEKWRDLM